MGSLGSDSESGSGSSTYEPDAGMTAVRASIPAIEAYYADNGTYKGVTLQVLKERYDAGLAGIEIVRESDQTYCVKSTTGGSPWQKEGPAAGITPGNCSLPPFNAVPPPQTDAESCVEWTIDDISYYAVGAGEPQPGHCPK